MAISALLLAASGDTVRIDRKVEGETDELVIEKVRQPEPAVPALA